MEFFLGCFQGGGDGEYGVGGHGPPLLYATSYPCQVTREFHEDFNSAMIREQVVPEGKICSTKSESICKSIPLKILNFAGCFLILNIVTPLLSSSDLGISNNNNQMKDILCIEM